jgi:citrate synthase
MPVIESAVTLVSEGKLHYRGHDACELARARSLEEVAALIWTGGFDTGVLDTPLHVVGGASASGLAFIHRAQSILPLVATSDALASDLRPYAVAQSGWRIVNLLTSVAAETSELAPTVEETLAVAWAPSVKNAPALLRAALILSADQEVDAATLAVRCGASARSNPYAAAVAGLAVLEGLKGEAMERVEDLFDDLRRVRDPQKVLAARSRRGEAIEGFGHDLYPDGDPRAAALLAMLPKSRSAARLAETAESVTGAKPSLELALVAVARGLRLPRGAAFTILAIGRTIGWIAHAIEQYELGTTIRPRSKYVGPAAR